nr:proteinase-activated receptor 1-like [Pogona vitticeps]
MAVLVFVVKIKLKKPAVVYMLNLASADLLLVSVLPFKIFYHFTGNNWPFGPEMCHLISGIFFCNTFCSMLLMTAMSVDRSLALLYPMQSLSWRTLHRASLVCAVIWLVAIVAVIYPMTNELTYNIPQLNITTCVDEPDVSVIITFSRYYIFVLSILFFYIPLLISSVCYASIIKKLSSSDVATKPGKKRRAILLSVAVLSSFILCFGPIHTLTFLQIVLPDTYYESLSLAFNLAFTFSTINCCLDPLIYYYASSECQRQVWTLLCPGKRSDVEKDIQETINNTTTYFSGLGHLTQA